jgi:hypothetical protein
MSTPITINQQGTSGASVNPKGITNNLFNLADPTKYTSLFDFIDEVNAPDVRANLVKTFGNQGITEFLQLTGATKNAGTADEVTYWEEARLHQPQKGAIKADAAEDATSFVIDGVVLATNSDNAQSLVARVGDILLVGGKDRFVVTNVNTTSATNVEITCKSLLSDGLSAALTADDTVTLPIVGNMFDQGTDQPSRFLQSNVVKRTNSYAIVKDLYEVSGSQATNIGYIDVGGGDYRWYIKSEKDTRQRFMDKRELTLLLGQKATNTDHSFDGTEGYFAALEDRGLVTSDVLGGAGTGEGFGDLDALIKEMDKNGCPPEYAMYVNTDQSLALDDMLAAGIATQTTAGLAGQFGAFGNSADMAVNLGFKSFTRGGYTFHKKTWKLLNDPTLMAADSAIATNLAAGVCIPLTTVADPKSGNRAPALEMNYKASNGYSREMEHWVTGGGVLGFTNDTKDVARFHYRSECNLVTRAANQHILIKGVA